MTEHLITATILKDSVNVFGTRLTTFQLTYPRIILAELNTHRVFSRNTSSLRAIPVKDNIKHIQNSPFVPIEWTKNQKGMFGVDYIDPIETHNAQKLWHDGLDYACDVASNLADLSLHKQYANRLLSAYIIDHTVLSATDFDNFFKLRIAPDAQPEIRDLAVKMKGALDSSIPQILEEGHWHLPYIDVDYFQSNQAYSINNQVIDLETARKVSVSCCAQVSYRKLNTGIDKAVSIFDDLFSSKHLSPMEHCATPISSKERSLLIEFRHKLRDMYIDLDMDYCDSDLDKLLYKRNFKEWTQYRALLNE